MLVTTQLLMATFPAWGSDGHSSQAAPAISPVPVMASTRLAISFQTSPNSPAVTGVELWYTKDGGKSWQRQAQSVGAKSPLAFDADGDGLYGFYIILRNTAGASSEPPTPGTAPQRLIRVDRTSPLVQLLECRPDENFAVNHEVHLRWSVRDENLPDRPVSLHYRTEQSKAFTLIAENLAANSSHRWTVPDNVSGRLEIKITAVDQAGNTGRYTVDWLRIESGKAISANARQSVELPTPARAAVASGAGDIAPAVAENQGASANTKRRLTVDGNAPRAGDASPNIVPANFTDPPAAVKTRDADAAGQAARLYEAGTAHRLRGEHALAAERLTEALRFNPRLTDARVDLAGVLILLGRQVEAEKEYQEVLEADAKNPAALKGLAYLQTVARNYETARRTLLQLVEAAPQDAEAWLYLGDVTMFTGDRAGAREAWRKADSLNGANPDIRQRAQSRLSIYRDSSSRN